MDHLIKGTLDLLILDAVAQAPTYGYRICQSVLARSDDTLELKEGSLYPALHRLERQKLLKSYWEPTPEGRRRKYYKLTPAGGRSLSLRRDQWEQFSSAINKTLRSQLRVGVRFG